MKTLADSQLDDISRRIVAAVARALKDTLGARRVILFGSASRQPGRPPDDVDLMAFVDDAAPKLLKLDVCVTRTQDWYADGLRDTPFRRDVERDAIEL